jgi:Phasin protein
MATNTTPKNMASKAVKAAADTAEPKGMAAKDTAERATQAAADDAERVSRTAADAVESITKAAANTAETLAATAADSLDAEAIASTTRESIAKAAKTQQQAIGTMERAGASLLTGLTEMQKEIAGFVSERIRQDIEGQQELLRCRTLDEVREVQSRYFRTAMDQYSSEATKLMQLGTELFTRSTEHRAN